MVATRDRHPEDHGSFQENGGRWPRHCVQARGAPSCTPGLATGRVDMVVDKGQKPGAGERALEEGRQAAAG